MVEKKFIFSIIIVIVLFAIIALFWYTFVINQGKVFKPLWESFKNALKNLFRCLPFQECFKQS
jgi:hypothetical protein